MFVVKKIFYGVLVVYVIIAAIITMGMLNYNEQGLTDIGGKVYIKAVENLGDYKKGDLLVVRNRIGYRAQDKVFYCKIKNDKCVVSYGIIESMMSGVPTIWGEEISNKQVIGIDRDVSVIPLMGSILNIMESTFGYLCIVILPILLAFIYIISSIVKEVKNKK